MTIDIFNLEPTVISRDLRGKIVLFYGEYKTGKTTNAVKFPKHLLLATEVGYNALSGVKAQKISKWSDFKTVLKQLRKSGANEAFETIIIDTADNLYDLCEKFILQREDVEKIGDIPYGQGYGMVEKEYDEALREIPLLGFGLVMISHSEDKTFKDENGEEYSKIVPTLPKKPRKIVLRMSDIIGFSKSIESETGTKTALYMRGTTRFEAGSRFKYTPDVIEFSYENLVNAIADAIEKQELEEGATVVTQHVNNYQDSAAQSYEDVFKNVQDMENKLVGVGKVNEVNKIVDTHLGKGKNIKEATEEQLDMLILIADDLKDLVENYSDLIATLGTLDFDKLKSEIIEVGKSLHDSGRGAEVTKTIESYLGKGKKVTDFKKEHTFVMSKVVSDLKKNYKKE